MSAPTPDAEVLTEPLRSRWSSRIFDPAHDLADQDLRVILEAARWAPSAGNSQPWAFLVARRGNDAHRAFTPLLSRGNSWWVPRASAVILSVAHVRSGPEPDAPDFSEFAEYDLGQAMAHMTVQAGALGLITHQFAGFDHQAAAEAFDVPPEHKVMIAMAIGVPGDPAEADESMRAREDRQRTRRPLSDFVYDDHWGTPWPGLTGA